jgi:peptidyl-tRNA hydrolase
VIVRKDLPVAQQLVQAAHAAHESGLHLCEDKSKVNYLVALEVPDEDRLLAAHERLEDRGIKTILFREPDRNNEATALCTEPIWGNRRKIFSKYSLWREAK